jgi:predicted PurR-regulated permease PerM
VEANQAIVGLVILALFFTTLFYPVLKWLQKKGLGTGLALLIIIVLVAGCGLALAALLVRSIDRLAEGLSPIKFNLKASCQN